MLMAGALLVEGRGGSRPSAAPPDKSQIADGKDGRAAGVEDFPDTAPGNRNVNDCRGAGRIDGNTAYRAGNRQLHRLFLTHPSSVSRS